MVLRDGDIEGLVSGVPVARRGDVLLGECFWASPMLNIMKPQGGLFFFVPVGEDAERRQDGGTFPDYFRAPVGASWKTRLIGRFPEIGKPWNKARKRPRAIIIGGTHDDRTHSGQVLQNAPTRPAASPRP